MKNRFIEQRLISVEILRSVVLIYFIFLYLYQIAFGFDPVLESNLYSIQEFWGVFLKYLTNMNLGLFSFLYGLSVIWTFTQKVKEGTSVWKVIFNQFGFFLFFFFLDLFYAYFFAPVAKLPFSEGQSGGLIPFSMNQGHLIFPPLEQFYHLGLFSLIGLSTFISSLLFAFSVWLKRRYAISPVILLSIIAFAWLFFVKSKVAASATFCSELYTRGGFFRILSFFYHMWGGNAFSANVVIPYALFGSILGYEIATAKDKKSFTHFSLFYMVILLGFFIFYLGTDIVALRVGSHATGMWNYLFQRNSKIFTLVNLLIVYSILTPLVCHFHFSNKKINYPQNWFYLFLLKVGRVSITVLVTIPFVGGVFSMVRSCMPPLLFFFVSLGIWFILLLVWQKLGFVYSIEYLMFKLVLFLNKRKGRGPFDKSLLDNADLYFFYFNPIALIDYEKKLHFINLSFKNNELKDN